MAIRTYKVILDSKNAIAPEPVLLRQGDKTGSVVIDATLIDNGYPVSLNGFTLMFKANTADGQAVIADSTGFNIVNANGGEFTYQVPSQLGSVPGKIKIAYFSLVDSNGNQSTFDIAFAIYPAADMTKESAKDWVSNLNDIINKYNQWVNDAHYSWDEFVNANKQIIESIDPGGTLLAEVIDARKPLGKKSFPVLGDRLNNYDKLINRISYFIEEFEVDGQTDWSQAFTNAINFISSNGGGSLVLGQGNIYEGQFILNKPNIKIFGGGTIKGTLLLDTELVDNTQEVLNAVIENIKFSYNGINDYCIELYRVRDAVIKDCYFPDGISNGIIFKQNPTYNQMAARIMIENNDFNGDYSLFCEHDTTFFPLADIHFNNNMCKNKISNINIIGVDGITFSNNTLFLPGSNKKDPNKKYNIYLKRAIWPVIDSANHLFEAGLESILLEKCQSPVIDSVTISWPGQRVPSDGIRIFGGDMEGLSSVMGTITGCNIIFPTKNGISIEENSGGVTVTGNKIKSAGYSGYYYGSTDLSTINHFGINTEATTSNLLITNNNTSDNINNILGGTNYYADNFDVNKNIEKKNRVLTLSTTDTIISVKGIDTINLNQPSSTSISSFTNAYDGQEITLVGFNGNTRVKTSAAYLSGRLDIQMSVGSVLKLRYSSGSWYETGRNIIQSYTPSGQTSERPTSGMQMGQNYYDDTIKKPIWWSGAAWKDASGNNV